MIAKTSSISNMACLRVNKAFRDILKGIISKVKLVYDYEIEKSCYHPLGRQVLFGGKVMARQLQELVVFQDCAKQHFINVRIYAGLGMMMEDRGRSHLIATLESETDVPIGIVVILSSEHYALSRGNLNKLDTQRLVSNTISSRSRLIGVGPR
jgi:hypothetical protein